MIRVKINRMTARPPISPASPNDLTKEFMPYIAWERTDFEDAKKADSTMYQVGLQLKF